MGSHILPSGLCHTKNSPLLTSCLSPLMHWSSRVSPATNPAWARLFMGRGTFPRPYPSRGCVEKLSRPLRDWLHCGGVRHHLHWSSISTAPHANCGRCRQSALEKDDLSLLANV